MKIDIYSVMYNEEKILPYWLKYYETFANRIFIWDDYSTDSTVEILKSHPKVTVLHKKEPGLENWHNVSVLFPKYEKYSRGKADWVMAVDADEFIYHPNIKKVLKRAMEHKVDILQCRGFDMISDKFPTTKGQIYDETQMGVHSQMMSKWAVHSPKGHVRYRKGRHGRPYDNRNLNQEVLNFCRYKHTGLKLLHYRYLGEEYIINREKTKLIGKNRMPQQPHVKYSRKNIATCPDGAKEPILDWLKSHQKDTFNVLDLDKEWIDKKYNLL